MPKRDWGLAQLGEHLLCKQGVVSSIPSSSTNHVQNKVDFPIGCCFVAAFDQYKFFNLLVKVLKNGCSLKFIESKISVAGGKHCTFVKGLVCTVPHQQHFDYVNEYSTFCTTKSLNQIWMRHNAW